MKTSSLYILTVSLLTFSCVGMADEANYINIAPVIDGVAQKDEWQQGQWYQIDQDYIGGLPDKNDFSGKYTLRWDAQHLYLLANIQDDVIFDQHPDPLHFYWDDDCLEIFIDEDASGGIHQYDYNAFAYHIAIDNQAVDIGPPKKQDENNFVLLNEHIQSAWKRDVKAPHKITWEVAIKVFDDSFDETKTSNTPVTLTANKVMGFMLAYCDNDGSQHRENFIGSHPIEPVNGDKNLGYITASVFDRLRLLPKSIKDN
jgi:hypothetical protein